VLLGKVSQLDLVLLRKRPFFWMLHVDAPLMMR
jgi:hypothetical protein